MFDPKKPADASTKKLSELPEEWEDLTEAEVEAGTMHGIVGVPTSLKVPELDHLPDES